MQPFVEMLMWARWGVVVMGLGSLELRETQQQQDEGKHAAGAAGKRDLAWPGSALRGAG